MISAREPPEPAARVVPLSGPWSLDQVHAYLAAGTLPLRLGCASQRRGPSVLSLWYVWQGGSVWCATRAASHAARTLWEDPRCGFEVVSDAPPYRGVRGHGRAELIPERGESVLRLLLRLEEQGFSERIVTRFLRPFFAGVFHERELATSSRFLAFAFAMFARGDAALPAAGMAAIPQQLASRLARGTLRLRTPVARVEEGGVVLASGERIEASAVVVATDAAAAARLVPGLRIPDSNPATCLSFDAPHAPLGPELLLDAEGEGPVNHVCVPSAVAPGYAPAGRAPRSPRLAPGVFGFGDYFDVASIQGALASGRRAVGAVAWSRRP